MPMWRSKLQKVDELRVNIPHVVNCALWHLYVAVECHARWTGSFVIDLFIAFMSLVVENAVTDSSIWLSAWLWLCCLCCHMTNYITLC